MSGLFSPKMPAVPEPVKPPTTDDARQAEEDLTKLRRRRGRAATFLMSQAGARNRGAASSLLGAGTSDTATTADASPALSTIAERKGLM